MIETIAASGTLEQAYAWYIGTRQDAHHNHEVWHLRRNWAQIRPRIQAQLRAGTYQFAPCRSCQVDGTWQSVWSAPDAVVQKAMALVLTERLSPHLSRDCYHLAGRGGQKGCVMRIKHAIRRYRYVCRSDVDSYYATINHQVLLAQIRERIPDPAICTLIARLLDRLDDVNAELHRVTVGITKGSPLSPLLGAIYLDAMDRAIGDYCRPRGLRYYRYMDDWLILCHTRHQLRAIVRLMNTQLNRVQQTKHPFKTYIGQLRTTGIDFLGYC
ncbi:MAG: reverse transcriptase/maturase family protein, partial [Pseudomonadota bacterium]